MAMADSLQKIYLFCSRGERMYFLMRYLSPPSSSLRGTLKGKNLLPWEQILSFKSNPQILSDTVSTIKVKNKNDFLYVRGYGKL